MAATAHARWTGSLDDRSGTMSTATGPEAFTKASRFAGRGVEITLTAAKA